MSSSLGHFQKAPTIAERLSPPLRVQQPQALGISPSIPLSDLGVNDHEEAVSEAETVVLEPHLQNGPGSRRRGRRRDSPDDDHDDDDDSDSDDRIERHSKRLRKRREKDVLYSSDLSSAPSAPSSPVRGSSHLRVTRNGSPVVKSEHHALSLSRKRKAPIDPEQHTNGSSRTRQAVSPKRNTCSSPYSPSPPPNSHRTRSIQTSNSIKTSHKAKRKVLSSLQDKRSSEERSPSDSRQGSPTGYPQLPRPPAARTPGSPVNPINMPHKPKRDASGRTLLHRAAQRGNLEEVINIFNQNQDLLNEEDNAGYIPLHEASLSGHTDVVNFLLSSGSYVDKQSHTDKDTPLMDAVENGHLEVVRLLLEKGADPKIRNKSGADALELMSEDKPDYAAIEEAIRAALQKRRSKRSSDDENRNSAQVESHSSRDPSVASPVHDTAPTSRHVTTGWRRNARADQTKNEMLWVEGGKNGLQKLREKARLGDSAIVHACLERGVKPDVESLIGAIKGGHDDTVSLLLAFGADADPEISRSTSTGKRNSEETPMLAAIGRNNLKILEYLLDKVDPLRKDSRGRSYMDISRDRAGDLWEQEVKLLQAAYDKAAKARGLTKAIDRSPTAKKKLEAVETKRAKSRRDSIASASTHRRSESTQSKMEDNSDKEFSAEVKTRQREHRPKEVDSTAVKKKRRLIPGKDLLVDKNLSSTSKNQELRSFVFYNDLTTHESRGSLPPKLKTEPKEVDMLDIPDVKSSKRDQSREISRERMTSATLVKAGAEKAIRKEAVIGKKRNKENDVSSTAKSSKPTSTDPEKKRRKIDSEEVSYREEVTIRKFKKGAEMSNVRLQDSRREEMRLKRLDSETRSDGSGKEEDTKKSTKDQELLRARNLAKEEEKKKRLTQEEKADKAERKRRKAEEAERKEREQLAQRREEEENNRKATERQEMVRETLRLKYLASEQESIMNRALEESNRCREEYKILQEKRERERLEQENLERIAEENRQRELRRMEMERRMEEERRKEQEEAERRRIAEEERERLRLEEEARLRAAAEERLQMEAAERRRVEEEARIQRERLEAQRLEEEAEKRRLLEEQRRESLPVALRKVAEVPNVPSVTEVGDYLPLYQSALDETNGDIPPNGSLPNGNTGPKVAGWILNIQAALILGEPDLSFQEYHLESREVSDNQKSRMWMLLTPILCSQRTFQSTNEEIFEDQRVNKEKFMRISPLLWLKLDDFHRILNSDPKYAHLLAKGLLRTSWVDLAWKIGDFSPPTPQPST